MVDQHSAAPQLRCDSPVAVPPLVFRKDLLNRRPYFHVLFHRLSFLQRPVKARPTHARQLTHPLDTQVALHGHQLPDLVVDAVSPACLLLWRRASTFCKAPLKKSASSVLSATSRFSRPIFCRSSRSRELAGGPSPSSIGSN